VGPFIKDVYPKSNKTVPPVIRVGTKFTKNVLVFLQREVQTYSSEKPPSLTADVFYEEPLILL